jgi:hypothetical protein
MFASWFTMGEVDHGLGTFQKWSVKKPTPTSSYALYFGNIAPTLRAFNLTQDFFLI